MGFDVIVASILENGVLVVIAALFLYMAWKMFGSWQKRMQDRDSKEERREAQLLTMLQSVTAALERSNSVIEASNRVIEGNQAVLEQVMQRNSQLTKTQDSIVQEVNQLQTLSNKIYTDVRVMLNRGAGND